MLSYYHRKFDNTSIASFTFPPLKRIYWEFFLNGAELSLNSDKFLKHFAKTLSYVSVIFYALFYQLGQLG